MSARFYAKKYKSDDASNWFEFVAETVAYLSAEYGAQKLGAELAMFKERDASFVVPPLYYGIKDLLLPEFIEGTVRFFAGSGVGRLILKRMSRIEDQRFILLVFNAFVLITLQSFMGKEIDPFQIFLTLLLEFGADEASDVIF